MVAVGLDEGHCLSRQPVGEGFAGGAIGERGDLVGGEVARRLTAVGAGAVDVEALLLGAMVGAAEMPLADRRRRIAGFRKTLGHRHRFERQMLLPIGDLQFGLRVFMAGDPVGEVEPGRRLPGHERRTCRRADGAGGVAGREADPGGGEPIDVGRLVKTAPLTAEVESAEIVDKDHDHVGGSRRGLVGPAGEGDDRGDRGEHERHALCQRSLHRAADQGGAVHGGGGRGEGGASCGGRSVAGRKPTENTAASMVGCFGMMVRLSAAAGWYCGILSDGQDHRQRSPVRLPSRSEVPWACSSV